MRSPHGAVSLPFFSLSLRRYKFACRTAGAFLSGAVTLSATALTSSSPSEVALTNETLAVHWQRQTGEWRVDRLELITPSGPLPVGGTSGSYTVLFAETQPSKEPLEIEHPAFPNGFPEPEYRFMHEKWREARSPAALNTAGQAFTLWPTTAIQRDDGLRFTASNEVAELVADWSFDPVQPGDIRVELHLTARRAGWFSLATPTLASVPREELAWAAVPGYFQGAEIAADFIRAYAYGHGLPDRPVLGRERVASTLASFVTTRRGATMAVVAEPGTGTDPWQSDRNTRQEWRLGLSHMNRAGELAPTLYHPVLGEVDSRLTAGETRTFRFRYSLRRGDWFEAARHVIEDIYELPGFLALKQPRRSLSERLLALRDYVADDDTSLWRTEQFGSFEIGAQAYLGGVVGSGKDAMKNSDYGAMWMLARLTGDPRLVERRLPYALNFKLAQQRMEPGFFQGAAAGQYYLSKSRRFTEEWGDYSEPVALTYYVLLDLGNILLFEPGNAELRERLRLAADRLVAWQHAEGNWEVAYDSATSRPRFRDVPDLRPTFYGLLIAYQILGDEKHLAAARRGADWLMTEGVKKGAFLGVCGDARFAPDFATAQIAQALLDLAETTGEMRYREAGLAAARFYVTSIYTHPRATAQPKTRTDGSWADWELNQTGLSYEHGTTIGSANTGGPILLASHAGLFLRVSELTGEPLFRDLARSAAWARDAFVDPQTSVASYYWSAMNKGAGPYPHHAWWQIGWITDYLVAEAALRSDGAISFPRGFMTPKVGPHCSYGFAAGKIFGEEASLDWGSVDTGSPAIDYLLARAKDGRRYMVLLNNSTRDAEANVRVPGKRPRTASLRLDHRLSSLPATDAWRFTLPATGLAVLTFEP